MNRYAVIGHPIAHSLSPDIHKLFAEQVGLAIQYDKISSPSDHVVDEMNAFFASGGKGLNVTMPHKQAAFSLCDDTTARCQAAQAANTLWQDSQGKLRGDNTDGIGFIRDLSRWQAFHDKSILILGAGGAARGIVAALMTAGCQNLTLTNRTLANAQKFLQQFPDIQLASLTTLTPAYDIVINTASGDFCPDSATSVLENKPFCYDLNYDLTQPTPFLQWVTHHGCLSCDGMGMLVEQAAESFYIWHGVKPDTVQVIHQLKARFIS